jgi:gamma-glutamyl-gamma-aminobutyrate hydrolase PuuD
MKIGLSQRILYHKDRAHDSIEHGWYSYLDEHVLSFIRNDIVQDFGKLADKLDCFIITGGDDTPIRRIVETRLATEMMKRNKPIIGICHGAFLLTDLLGGEVDEVIAHMDTSHVAYYFGEEKVVNSYHNLRIKTAPKLSNILVVDHENNCEAWIDGKIAAVVWHPERMTTPWLPDEIQDLLTQRVK